MEGEEGDIIASFSVALVTGCGGRFLSGHFITRYLWRKEKFWKKITKKKNLHKKNKRKGWV